MGAFWYVLGTFGYALKRFGNVFVRFWGVFARVSAADARGEEDVVVAGDDEVGDFVHFGEGLLGAFEVVAVGKNLSGGEVGGGGDGIAGDDGGADGLGDEQAGLAGGVAEERVEVDAFGKVVGGGLDAGEEGAFFGDEFVGALVLAPGGFFGGVEGFGGGFDFGGVHPPGGFGKMFEAAAVHGSPVGEEDVGDVFGFEAGAFVDSGFEGLCGGGTDQRGGSSGVLDPCAVVRRRVVVAWLPRTVMRSFQRAFERAADADDDEFHFLAFGFLRRGDGGHRGTQRLVNGWSDRNGADGTDGAE